MFKIENSIRVFLTDNNYEFIEILQKSERKKTYILKIRKHNKYFILKTHSKDSPEEIKKKFITEIEFYKKNQNEYLPKLILNKENNLIIEYIDGVTLRKSLIKNEITEENLKKLFNYIEQFHNESKLIIKSNTYNFNNAFSHLSNLIQSGPIQTKKIKINILTRVFNKTVLFLLRIKLKKITKNLDIGKLKKGFIHGDFHYNNILISNKEIKFIDFENVRNDGYFDFDILYLLVMTEVLLKKNKKLEDVFHIELNNYLHKNVELIKVFDVYKMAISFNKKFQLNIEK